MTDKPLKAPDIAEIAGVSAGEMKRIAEEYKVVIPSRVFGRVKLYEQKAAGIVEKISSMEAAGKTTADIIRELGGKAAAKSTKEKTGEKIRKKQSAPAGNNTPSGKTPASRPSRGKEDETAFIELKLNRLTNRVEQLEKQLLAERAERNEERKEYLRIIAEITENTDATGEWVDYFDKKIDDLSAGQDEFNKKTLEWIDYTEEEIDLLKKPFWKRRR
ncbi:hypothetical protein [Methanolacinia paynteri]|uniref:hypothetical protein n=1 Tax=Methanolacinia paynteri TaxID=230356 RepID=UPI00064E7146|nr:hypothetical protein [Methanolacinia paynteri]